MKKYNTILICDVCKKRTKRNYMTRKFWFLYLLFFASFSFFQWVLDFETQLSKEVICADCSKSFKRWVESRRVKGVLT